ncbi:MAG: type II toxin-antitoxin system HipA family toxin [Hyphomicrobiales bacterium]|nr:type II toxin-antitoxin system HipA family toxin [Hyphomicrobiales bacterium]MBV8826688.1 type II toxin-antitoxin system HipA family toxin [Hyphomicrobiales bacterium]MBV9429515.1 type II toxin-antitoxin system HipA family toxin [Bradyrhizobiaceae bacterium]
MPTRTTYVYMHLSEGPVPAGRLDMTEEGRNSYATFQYGNRYLGRSNRVAVDPAVLPLPDPDATPQTFRTAEGFELFNGIRDAAPDGWGRYLMHKAAGTQNLTEFDYLIASGNQRVGALAFGPDPVGGPKRMAPWGEEGAVGEQFDLAELAEAAERIQSVEQLEPDLKLLLEAGSSLGGARPKAAMIHDGVPWIAKFSAKSDTYAVCRAEFAVMRLAKECELDIPETDFKTLLNRDIYLIRRFDRNIKDSQLARIPFASALTMLEAHEIAAHEYSYREIAEVLRRYGADPRRDLRELFRRMAFNILVGNDDDHLRNHAFLYDGRDWRLSPLYDVVPRPHVGSRGRLILGVGDSGHDATLANALSGTANFGLKREEAAALLEDLRERVNNRWHAALTEAGLGRVDIERLASCFAEAGKSDWQKDSLGPPL